MAQYNVKVQVGDRVRYKSTGQVYVVMSVGLPPVAVHILQGATEVVLEKEGTREPLYRGTVGGLLEDNLWEKVL